MRNLKNCFSDLTLYKIFCIALSMFATLHILQTSYWNIHIPQIFNYMITFRTYFLLTALILMPFRLKRKRDWISFLGLFTLFLISMGNSGIINYLVIITFCFFIADEDIDKAIKHIGIGAFLGLFLVIGGAVIGLLPNELRGARNRQNIGFRESVMASLFYLNVTYVALYLNRNKFNFRKLLYIFVPGAIIFYLTNGRMSFALMTFVLISFFVYNKFLIKYKDKISKILPVIIITTYFFILFLSIFAAANFHQSQLIQSLNTITTGRMEWFSRFWDEFNLTWLGQSIPRIGGPDARALGVPMMILDSGYLNMLIRDGIIPLIIISIVYILLIIELGKRKDIGSLIIWLSITLGLAVMNGGLFFWGNPLLFQFTILIKGNGYMVGKMDKITTKLKKHYKVQLSK